MAAEQPQPLALWIGRGAGGMRLVLAYGLKLPTTVVTIVNLFTLSVQNLIFTNPVGLANPTKQCESLAEGVADE